MQRIFETPQIRISVFDSRDAIVTDSTGTTAVDNVRQQLLDDHKLLKAEQIIVFNE
ncbi:MAG: hypothetical protein J1G06_06920 [Oscillospiraceae bacterium]|nr:hypothetical protein [Oscillospiraceae bacterium]